MKIEDLTGIDKRMYDIAREEISLNYDHDALCFFSNLVASTQTVHMHAFLVNTIHALCKGGEDV